MNIDKPCHSSSCEPAATGRRSKKSSRITNRKAHKQQRSCLWAYYYRNNACRLFAEHQRAWLEVHVLLSPASLDASKGALAAALHLRQIGLGIRSIMHLAGYRTGYLEAVEVAHVEVELTLAALQSGHCHLSAANRRKHGLVTLVVGRVEVAIP